MGESNNLLVLHKLFNQCAHAMNRTKKYQGKGWLLTLLRERGTLTQRALIEITGRRSATLSEQLESMERAGWITRKKNDTDKRNVDVALTPLGQEAADEAARWRRQHAETLFCVLTKQEQDQLTGLLEKLAGAWATLEGEEEAK